MWNTKCQDEVNVLLGRQGWYKRVDKDQNNVSRKTILTDSTNLDPTGLATDRIFNGAKREIIAKHTATVSAPIFQTSHASSSKELHAEKKHHQTSMYVCFVLFNNCKKINTCASVPFVGLGDSQCEN